MTIWCEPLVLAKLHMFLNNTITHVTSMLITGQGVSGQTDAMMCRGVGWVLSCIFNHIVSPNPRLIGRPDRLEQNATLQITKYVRDTCIAPVYVHTFFGSGSCCRWCCRHSSKLQSPKPSGVSKLSVTQSRHGLQVLISNEILGRPREVKVKQTWWKWQSYANISSFQFVLYQIIWITNQYNDI